MPKMKRNRSAQKRFRLTSSGKVRRNHAFVRHILTKKTRKRKRQLRHRLKSCEFSYDIEDYAPSRDNWHAGEAFFSRSIQHALQLLSQPP